MTTSPENLYPAEPHATAAPSRAGRTILAAALVFVGGYLVMSSLGGQLSSALAGFLVAPPSYLVLLVAQLLFAILVVLAGLFAAAGSSTSKLIGSLVVVVGVALVVILSTMRLTGPALFGVASNYTVTNPWFMTVLLVGIAWLLVRRARVGWLALLGVVVLSPALPVMVMAGLDSGVSQLGMLALSAIVGAGILAAGRPWQE